MTAKNDVTATNTITSYFFVIHACEMIYIGLYYNAITNWFKLIAGMCVKKWQNYMARCTHVRHLIIPLP